MSIKDNFVDVFMRVKPVKMLVQLNKRDKKRYASVISRDCETTYSHTCRTLQEFHKHKLIIFNKKGRLKEIDLTETGRRLAETFERALNIIEKLK